jgi:nitrogen fixation/metabolism regulation signal transduction histidine kinase
MKWLVIIGAAVAAVGLFLLATASADTTLFARHYPLLLGLNATLAALLAALVVTQLVILTRRLRARVFGARLTLRLLARFAALAVVPGLIVYAVSVQFLTRSIESWFDVKVDAALEGGINLGQQVVEQMTLDLQSKANAMALELAERPPTQLATQLERLRAQLGIEEAVVVTGTGRLLASAGQDVTKLVPELPASHALRQARAKRSYSAVDATAGRPLALRIVVPMDLATEVRFLQVRQSVPPAFARSAEAVEAAYRDYRELAISRDGLKRIYIVTLTFALLMALFVAVAVAATQSGLLAEPLARRLLAPRPGDQPRRARRAHRVVQLDDAPARGGAPRGRIEPAGTRGGQGAAGEHSRQPLGRRAGVRSPARALDLQPRRRGDPRVRARLVCRAHARAFRRAGREELAARAAAEGHG